MGLSITVGILADLAENDPEGFDDVRDDFVMINVVLRQHGLPEHAEPEYLAELKERSGATGLPYSFLHYLRRFYARWVAENERNHPFRRMHGRWVRQRDRLPPPVAQGEKPAHDPALNRIGSPRHHLLWHSDCEGYYVPIDFPEVLEGEGIAGAGLGSSVRLMEELLVIAAPLGIVLHDRQLNDADAETIADEAEGGGPYWIERLVWLTLFEASRLSIEHRAAIHFG